MADFVLNVPIGSEETVDRISAWAHAGMGYPSPEIPDPPSGADTKMWVEAHMKDRLRTTVRNFEREVASNGVDEVGE